MASVFHALLLAVLSVSTSQAVIFSQPTVIFQENFDNSPPYSDGGAVPTGLNTISYGQWGVTTIGSNTVTTPTSESLSATRSVELHQAEGAKSASLTGYFGTNNTSLITTTDSIKLTLAFKMPDQNSNAEVWIRDVNWATLGYIRLRTSTSNGTVDSLNGGAWNDTKISIDIDEWYYLELLMPVNPNIGGSYTYSIYESDGVTQVGSSITGAFAYDPSGAASYRTFTLNVDNASAGKSVYFDNITVQAIPEAGSLGMVALGLALLALHGTLRRRRA